MKWHAIGCRLLVLALVVTGATLSPAATANGSDLPPQIVLQGFVKPEDGRVRLLVRIPLVFLQPFNVPKRGVGYIDLVRVGDALQQAGVAAGRQIVLFENGTRLVPAVRNVRISVLSDRSFGGYEAALAHLAEPPLPSDTDLFWNQGFFDAQIEYPIRSVDDRFSISMDVMPDLGRRVVFRLQFLGPNGPPRNLELYGGSTSVALDPSWLQAAWLFTREGFARPFAIDHLVFVLCLAAPFRRLRALLAVIAALAFTQAVTLTAAASGAVGENHWLAPFAEVGTAIAILLLAVGNLGAPRLRRRWAIAALVGALGGFGLGAALAQTLQLGGAHVIVSIAAFDAGTIVGEIAALVLVLAALRALAALALGDALALVVLSALAGHAAWHAVSETFHELVHQVGHTQEAGQLAATIVRLALLLAPAIATACGAFFLPRDFGGSPVATLQAALRRGGNEAPRA